jgi:dihydroorotase-like cyclic amidohydrolase
MHVHPYTVDAADLRFLSRNTPFDGWQLKGKPVLTMMAAGLCMNFNICEICVYP